MSADASDSVINDIKKYEVANLSAPSANKFKKKKNKKQGEPLSKDEIEEKKQKFKEYVKECTDFVICKYLSMINDYPIEQIFKNINKDRSGVSVQSDSKEVYNIRFCIVNDVSKYEVKRPTGVSIKVFNEALNHMDTLLRSNKLFEERYEEYLKFQNSRKNPPKKQLIDGGKIFLLEGGKEFYYVGNKYMLDKHIAFVEEMRKIPFGIGFEIEKEN